ncbi:chorion protein b at 7F [Cochliomyia hominivorax]
MILKKKKFYHFIFNTQISCVQTVPIEVIYTGDSCDCPKSLNYLVNVPPPPKTKEYKPSEYEYKLDVPLQGKAKVTYSFDFTVEEPKAPPPPPVENKWDIYAKIDRITAHKKDCYATKEVPNTCSCSRCAVANRYVLPEEHAARYARNLPHPNSLDDIQKPSTSQIMAIFLEPIKQAALSGVTKSKTRNKRDISRIFMKPRKNTKRSERVVKQYSKRLTDPASSNKKPVLRDIRKPIKSRPIKPAVPAGMRPLKQLKGFLTMPRFRNRRDIKGEYDLIEKEREQMDLTLPEIIQYMPETLDPNFKRNQCHFGEQCQTTELTETTTKTTTTVTSSSTTGETTVMTTCTANENKDENDQKSLKVTGENKEEEEDLPDNTISSHTKRNAADYANEGGCPLAANVRNPTPNDGYTFEPLPSSYADIPRPFVSPNNPYGSDPVPQEYVGAPHNPYMPTVLFDPTPLVGAAYPNPNAGTAYPNNPSVQQLSNAQLDRILADIINRHADFIQASSHQGGGSLVLNPRGIHEQQAKLYKNLMGGNLYGWFGDVQPAQHYRAHIPHQHVPAAAHVHAPPPPPPPPAIPSPPIAQY